MRQRRWLELIKDYNCEILYHSGKANMVADALSRKERLKMIMTSEELIKEFEKMEIDMRMTEKKMSEESGTLTGEEVRCEKDEKWIMRYSIHPGSTKMYRDLKEYYWWPNMKREVAEWVSKCLTCQRVKAEHQRPSGLLRPLEIPEWKWEHIAMDFMTGLPRTKTNRDAIWVIIDRLTKSAHFLPINERYTVEKLVDIYLKEIVVRHGVPVAIVSDRDPSERTIQTLEDMLRVCAIHFKGNWDDYLSLIEFAYNNSYHASIGMPPYEALYGRRCRSPLCWDEVGEQKILGPELVQQTREMTSKDREYEVGDSVLLKVSPWKGVMRFGKKGSKNHTKHFQDSTILKNTSQAFNKGTTTTMARTRRTVRALEGGTPTGTTQVISSTVEVPPHSTYAATHGEAQIGATEPQPHGMIPSATQGTNPQVQQLHAPVNSRPIVYEYSTVVTINPPYGMPLYPEVGGSGHAGRSEARGRSPPIYKIWLQSLRIRNFLVLTLRETLNLQMMKSTQETNSQEVQERIKAHEAEIQRLKRDLESHQNTRPPLPPRGRNPPPIIDLDGLIQIRVVVPRADPSNLLPLGDPDDPNPPFTEEIMNAHISRKFKMPTIKAYDGTGDPANHVRTFPNILLLQPVNDAIKFWAFPQTLSGAKESLRDYLIVIIALQQGTRDEFFKMSLDKRPPESMLQLQDRAGKYIKVEESMRKTVVSNEPAGGKKQKTDLEYIAKDKYPRTEQNPDSTPKRGGPGQKFTEYAKLNAPRSQILMEIEKDRDIRWPKLLKADPAKLDKSKYCRFHKDVGYDTDECRQLKDKIEFLIRKGRLNKYIGDGGDRSNNVRKNFDDRRRDQEEQGRNPQPRGPVINTIFGGPRPRGPVINTIFGGPTVAGLSKNSRKAYAREVMHIIG
ncbi:hypothetical protein AgCh_027832 [Apium graveolens]